MHNAIILTSGLTGSSVLTGLLAQARYWPGDRTAKKKDYDTFENEDLIRLNLGLFERAEVRCNYQTVFSPETIGRISALTRTIDVRPYRAFFNHCESHRPWVWKNPRLWMTIRFWRESVDLSDCNFLLLTRDHFQCWVSANTRRIVQCYRHTRTYESAVEESIRTFLEENRFPYQHITYDDLVAQPELSIGRLNRFLRTKLSAADLADVYRGPVRRRPASSLSGIVKAALICAKNYHERADSAADSAARNAAIKTPAPLPEPHSPSE